MRTLSPVTFIIRLVVIAGLALAWVCPALATTWLRAESAHFVVYSNTFEGPTRTYLNNLEQYRYVLNTLYHLSPEDDAAQPKLDIYFLQSPADMKATWPKMPENVAGYFKVGCSQSSAAFAQWTRARIKSSNNAVDQEENTSQVVIFHEYAHHFMFNFSAQKYPPWFVEGFADFYGTTKMVNDQVVVGTIPDWRFLTLKNDHLLPYEVILNSERAVLKTESETDAFYAQSWLLAHYMMSSPERMEKLRQYLKAYEVGEDPVKIFETIVGIRVADLGKVLNAYFSGDIRANIYKLSDMPKPQITMQTLLASSDKLLLWNAASKTCPNTADKEKLMQDIAVEAAKHPGDDYAGLTLAQAQVTIGDEAQAIPYLTDYTTRHADDAQAASLLGEAYYLMVEQDKIPANETRSSLLQKSRLVLGQAYRIDPHNPATMYYLSVAQADKPDYPNDTAVNAAIEAHNLSPSVQLFAIHAARLLIIKDRAEDARFMLYPIANNPHGRTLAKWATTIIAAIDHKAPHDELLSLLNAPTHAPKDDD